MPPFRPTPSIPTGGLFSAFVEGTINAPPEKLYDAILDTSQYPQWCTFVPQIDVTSQPAGSDPKSSTMAKGTSMTFHVQMTEGFRTLSKEEVNIVDARPRPDDPPGTKYRVCWVGKGIPGFVMRAERLNEITKVDENKCTYETTETFTGAAAYVVRWKFESTLQSRFEDWIKGLKAYCEGLSDGKEAKI